MSYTWVDEQSIRRLVQGILEGFFRVCSGLFRRDVGRFLMEAQREFKRNQQEHYTGKIRTNPKEHIA